MVSDTAEEERSGVEEGELLRTWGATVLRPYGEERGEIAGVAENAVRFAINSHICED